MIMWEWVESMFMLEDEDLWIFKNFCEMILDRGGIILFVFMFDFGVVGICVLMFVEGLIFEFIKMGVKLLVWG